MTTTMTMLCYFNEYVMMVLTCISLQCNSNCERVMFEGNEIGQAPAVYFGDVLQRNNYITEMVRCSLSWCHFSGGGNIVLES